MQSRFKSGSSDKKSNPKKSQGCSRRTMLQALGVTTVASTVSSGANSAAIGPLLGAARETEALNTRVDAANYQSQLPSPSLPCNDDETIYASRIGSFSKTLPHNSLGEVEATAYDAFLTALSSGDANDFNAIPAGGTGALANPRAAYSFSLVGADPHKIDMPAVHAFDSARQAAEAGEVYWMALTRDIRFTDYNKDKTIKDAASDMSAFSDFTGPKSSGVVTPDTLFRGLSTGDLIGPYISQFLYLDIPYGNRILDQAGRRPISGDDYMSDYGAWLAVQNGQLPSSQNQLQPQSRYITTGRDLGEYVHRDYSYQAYLNAGLIALGFGGALDSSPYSIAAREAGFVTFGPAALLDMVSRAGGVALRVAWFHKWLVHRKLRPESFGGRIHNHVTGAASYPIHSEILNSSVLSETFSNTGTYLLPQAFPEGSPTHPSYPAGHAVIAGACVTVLKAFFDEDFLIPQPMLPNNNGSQIKPLNMSLKLGDELNKLASNIALGRNIAGVHWRADGDDGLVAGEDVAITMLQDHLRCTVEPSAGFGLTKFDGTKILITENGVQVM